MTHNNLFTSSSKRIKKNVKRVLSLLGICALLFSVFKILDYLYVREDEWARSLWHDYYAEENNIDNIIVGSSHVYCDVNPYHLDKINGKNNFNISVSGMNLMSSYYAIKEVDKKHDLSNVYLEIYYQPSVDEAGKTGTIENRMTNWRCTDYMKPSCNNMEFRFKMSEKDNVLDTFIPWLRYREQLFDTNHIKEQFAVKGGKEYQNYQYKTEEDEGLGKGVVYRTQKMTEKELFRGQGRALSRQQSIVPDAEEYLRKTVEYCQKEDINITLFASPMYNLQLISAIDYDSYVKRIQKIAEEYAVPYYDFNLCSPKYLDIQKREYFFNPGHLNAEGADLYTEFFWKVVSGEKEDNRKYFCDSYQQKLAAESPEIFGVYTVTQDEGENVRCMNVASNRKTGMEYRIIMTTEEGVQTTVQDFTENTAFRVPMDEHGTVTVVARVTDTHDNLQTLEIGY